MIVKTKKVYYCEFCKKRSLQSLVEHEKHCTLNINRTCRLCYDYQTVDLKKIVDEVKSKIQFITEGHYTRKISTITIAEIKAKLEVACPNCILAIIRISGLPYDENFDYKKELASWWKDCNKDRYEFQNW